jgi:hypothetical protein
MLLFPESGPKKDFRVTVFKTVTLESGPKKDFRVTASLKTVTPHLRSIVPNVQRQMAYLAAS